MLSAFALATPGAAVSGQPPMTNIPCDWIKPVDVPLQPDLYLGTWYTIATATKSWQRNHVCTQVIIGASSNATSTDRVYTGAFYQTDASQTTPNVNLTQASGALLTADLATFSPPYKLKFDFLPPSFPPNDFYIAATDGDGTPGGITAIATYTCAPGMNNSQLFYLSRAPYLMPPATVGRLASKVSHAIGNSDIIQMDLVGQAQGWCKYPYPPTSTPELDGDDDDGGGDDGGGDGGGGGGGGDCLKSGSCPGGLKCETGESGGICVPCTGQYESPCGNKCCLGGQECHQGGRGGDSCDIP